MDHIKFKDKWYSCCAPRKVDGRYTCDAFNRRTGNPISSKDILEQLARKLLSGKYEDAKIDEVIAFARRLNDG